MDGTTSSDAACVAVAALVLSKLPVVAPTVARVGERPLAVLRDRPYALLALLNMFMLLYMPLFTFVIPLWIVRRTDAPAWTVSAMLVLNMVSVVLFQVRVARRVSGLHGAARFSRYAGLAMLAACAVFALSAAGTSTWLAAAILLAGACLQVVGEMLQAAGSWQVSFALAPAGKQGQYQGFFGAGAPVARMLGPLLLSTVILSWGVSGWLLLGGLFALAGCAMAPAVRWARRQRARVESQPVLVAA
jgi:MFS family permease